MCITSLAKDFLWISSIKRKKIEPNLSPVLQRDFFVFKEGKTDKNTSQGLVNRSTMRG